MRAILVILAAITASLFYFPFEFTFLPGINTKMVLAVIGLVLWFFEIMRVREIRVDKNILFIFLAAGIVSIVGLVSIIYNNTVDKAYASYIVSMIVWLSAAYAICRMIKGLHGSINLELICSYLTAICLAQCVLAILIDNLPALKTFVDTYVSQGQGYLNKVHRIYGIGASLDTAGTRFAACLIVLGYLITKNSKVYSRRKMNIYVLCFVLLFILGNFIARTTSTGAVIAMLYYLIAGFHFSDINLKQNKAFSSFLSIIIVVGILGTSLYNSSIEFRRMIEFGFEGFISLIEKGRWEVDSNESLKSMIVFPENTKTWIIGDGYFDNPYSDSHYIGDAPVEGNFYMGTDLGYLRFLFYFGIIGLIAFSMYFVVVAKVAATRLQEDGVVAYMLLILGFVIWLKVSTDIFLVFALLICSGYLSQETDDRYNMLSI